MEQQKNLGTTQVAVQLTPQVWEIIKTKAQRKGVTLDRYLGDLAEREAQLMQIKPHHLSPSNSTDNRPDVEQNAQENDQEQETAEILAQLNQAASETSRRLKRVHLAMQDINSELHAMHSKDSVGKGRKTVDAQLRAVVAETVSDLKVSFMEAKMELREAALQAPQLPPVSDHQS